ncbi:MAG: nuclease A inhibitor family protein, partial [Pyrinomonadaceae bacterium]
KNCASLFDRIDAAVDGLNYVSETDAPFAAFTGSEADVEMAASLGDLGRDGSRHMEEISIETFFDRLISVRDWHGEREKEKAKKFLALKKLLEENLRDLKVYRIGKIRIDIYVVGIDAQGCVTGVTTKAVET